MQRLLLEDFLGVAGDHQLLVGSDDQSADLGAPGGDVAAHRPRDAHSSRYRCGCPAIHVVADLCTGDLVVLADAAGEDDGVHAAIAAM